MISKYHEFHFDAKQPQSVIANQYRSPNLESFDSPPLRSSRNLPNRTRPIVYFEQFFDEEVLNNIILQTNKYANQLNARNWKPVTVTELKAFLGIIVIQMGIHVLPTFDESDINQ